MHHQGWVEPSHLNRPGLNLAVRFCRELRDKYSERKDLLVKKRGVKAREREIYPRCIFIYDHSKRKKDEQLFKYKPKPHKTKMFKQTQLYEFLFLGIVFVLLHLSGAEKIFETLK